MSLNELNLRTTYRSVEDDILNEFYVPCLERSVIYKRAVGFFTSGSLAEAARGVVDFVKNGGRMFIVACPRLTVDDMKKIKEGYEKRRVLEDRLIESIGTPISEVDEIRVKNLSWMIANELLDIRIAVPTKSDTEGIYHEKVGIFFGSGGEGSRQGVVAFTGSLNETREGLISNYESIDVFVSWDKSEREQERINGHVRHFDSIWENRATGIETYEFPEAAARKLLETYRPELPTFEPGRKRVAFDFQRKALESWKEKNYQGILAMATGTGKTFTALRCVESTPKDVLILVVVPQEALVEQWRREIEAEYDARARIIEVHSEADWKERLDHLVDGMRMGVAQDKRNFVVGTIQTMHKPRARAVFGEISSEKLMLIVDEVHHSGARLYRNLFQIDAQYRLGLSATPERFWDDTGNQAIFDYFGPTVYEYDIQDAIKDKVLTPYEYHIRVISLTPQEREEFKRLSNKITQQFNRISKAYPELGGKSVPVMMQRLEAINPGLGNTLRVLYLKRVELVKAASNKLDALRQIVQEADLKRCLVYCNNLVHLNECAKMLHKEGRVAEEYSSGIDVQTRARLLASFAEDYSQTRFLLSVRCLDEGIDLPAVDSAILIASSRSTREFVQRRGRILRRHPSKTIATIYDIVALPVERDRIGYSLSESERRFVQSELSRVVQFSLSAKNAGDSELQSFMSDFRPFIITKD